MKPKISILISLLLQGVFLMAQTDYGSYTAIASANPINLVSDYQCLGINPANLGWNSDNHQVHFGFAGVNISVYTNALSKSDLKLFIEDNEYTLQEKVAAALRFSDSKTSIDVGLNGFGLAIQQKNFGGIAFNFRERASFTMELNEMAAELLWLGFNSDYFDQKIYDANGILVEAVSTEPQPVASLLKGTRFTGSWLRDYQLGYGRHIFNSGEVEVYGGFDFKITQGFSWVDVIVDEQRLYAYNAMSPVFKIEYNTPSPSALPPGGLKPVGKGFGFDVGLSGTYHNWLRFGLSLNNIGRMKWNGNLYRATYEAQIRKMTTEGLGNEQLGQIFEAVVIEDQILQWEGISEYSSSYPAQLRMGAAYTGLPDLVVGAEFMLPLNKVPGTPLLPVAGAGLQFSPADFFILNFGMQAGGNYNFHLPVGIGLKPLPGWELGIATGDIGVFFRKTSPHINFAMGFLRFSFGPYEKNRIN